MFIIRIFYPLSSPRPPRHRPPPQALWAIMHGANDRGIAFTELQGVLERLGFQCRVKGDHYIYTKDGVEEIILYWSSEDNAYIAEVPELAGCMADGATARDALHNVEQIAAEWIETAQTLGRDIPEPKGRLLYA